MSLDLVNTTVVYCHKEIVIYFLRIHVDKCVYLCKKILLIHHFNMRQVRLIRFQSVMMWFDGNEKREEV